MKNAILPTICLLLCTLCIIFMPTEAEAAIYEDTVRLHILAPSDSAEDQALKIKIRDMILEKYGSAIENATSSDTAREELLRVVPDMTNDCKTLILDTGLDYNVEITVSEEWFNTREYKDFTLPAGFYSSLKIVLGEGEGQNWWCVMYPPLCLDAALSEEVYNYSEEEYKLITSDGYMVKFKLLELASGVIRK